MVLALLVFVSRPHRRVGGPSDPSLTGDRVEVGGSVAPDLRAKGSAEKTSNPAANEGTVTPTSESPPEPFADAAGRDTDASTEIPPIIHANKPGNGRVENATRDDDIVARDPASARERFTALDLSGAATAVSTPGLLGREPGLVFDDWSRKEFKGVPFQLVNPQGGRVPNVVVLYGPHGELAPTMPTLVNVPCRKRARAIHFLSGVSGWGAPHELKDGSVSMIVSLRYADGQTENHPLRNGEYFAEWVTRVDVPKSKLAFRLGERQLRYFAIYPNRPEPIEGIDLVKGPDDTAPIVMAITVEQR